MIVRLFVAMAGLAPLPGDETGAFCTPAAVPFVVEFEKKVGPAPPARSQMRAHERRRSKTYWLTGVGGAVQRDLSPGIDRMVVRVLVGRLVSHSARLFLRAIKACPPHNLNPFRLVCRR